MAFPLSRSYCLGATLVLIAAAALGQNPAPAPALDIPTLQQVATANFGAEFKVEAIPGAPTPALVGDLDGDGQEDIVMMARAKDPLGRQGEFHYKVVDPYDSYWGLGDPKITTRFGRVGDEKDRVVLVIHAWRAQQPRAKFAVINLPFDTLTLETRTVKRKSRLVMQAVEQRLLRAWVFWDGHRYRWEPGEAIDD